MSLPASWVDELFKRLTVRYGSAFMAQYRDIDAEAVKADWSRVLSGFKPESIRYALEILPSDHAPNALQFRALCNARPCADDVPRLEGPKPAPDRVASLLSRMRTAMESRNSGPDYCASRLREIAKVRPLTLAQRAALAECERNSYASSGDDMSGFRPIDPAVLPPGMRA